MNPRKCTQSADGKHEAGPPIDRSNPDCYSAKCKWCVQEIIRTFNSEDKRWSAWRIPTRSPSSDSTRPRTKSTGA